jgi:YHS domain-containing protein
MILTGPALRVAAIALIGFGLGVAAAPAGEINTGYFGNVAIKGYDPVAYFEEGRAVKGSRDHAYEWFGVEWYFAKPEYRALFEDDPVAYAPQYGGICADGVAYGGMTVNIDPEAFVIINGKLYLNHDAESARELTEIPGQVKRADANWPTVEARWTGN